MTNKRIEHKRNKSNIINIQGIECYEQDGVAYLELEAVARGLGFTRTAASGNEVVMWSRVAGYLQDLGVHTSVHGEETPTGRDGLPDFIPENIFYRLAMKAKNEAAEAFQAKVADEIIPSIRKQGKHRKHRDPNTYFFRDLKGQKFGHLTVIEQAGRNKHRSILWRCICDCGNEKIYPSGKLISGRATNCGCKTTEIKSMKASKHGITAGVKPRTFTIWNGMKARCLNPKSISYKNYGGRGITICDEWMKFENFHKWAISSGYKDGYEIDRIDNDGNYCPENCHWVTVSENRKKTRNTHYITVDGTTKCVSEWCKLLHVSKSAAYKILKNGDNDFSSFCKERLSETEAV